VGERFELPGESSEDLDPAFPYSRGRPSGIRDGGVGPGENLESVLKESQPSKVGLSVHRPSKRKKSSPPWEGNVFFFISQFEKKVSNHPQRERRAGTFQYTFADRVGRLLSRGLERD